MRDSKPMVDTNILVYAHNQDSPYFNQAKSVLAGLIDNGGFCLTSLILLEFFSVITNGRKIEAPLSPDTALCIIEDMLESQLINVIESHDDLGFFQWLRNYSDSTKRYQIYDASIAYAMFQNEVTELYTNNTKDFKKFDFIKTINPVSPSAVHSARPVEFTEDDSVAYSTGAPCALRTIPYARQSIDEKDLASVCKVLRSDWLTTGPKVEEFETAVADYVGAEHAVAVSSGTAALHAATFALGIGPGDEVIVPPMTFAATANCILYQGGTPVFADVDPNTLLIDPEQLEAKISSNTRAIIGVDYAGQPCDWDALRDIANRHSLHLVDDGCHALGAEYKGKKLGTLADLTVFSFHPVKHITTGEGGMITTDNADYAEKMRLFRNHGITRDPKCFSSLTSDLRPLPSDFSWFYEMKDLGYNYRITDIQCALGVSQLRKLPGFLERRHEIAKHYDEALSDIHGIEPLGLRADVLRASQSAERRAQSEGKEGALSDSTPCSMLHVNPVEFTGGDSIAHSSGAPCSLHAYHLYVVRVDPSKRNSIFNALRKAGIGVNVHYIPVHLHPYYREKFKIKPGLCPKAEEAYRGILSLPIFQDLSDQQVQEVVSSVMRAL